MMRTAYQAPRAKGYPAASQATNVGTDQPTPEAMLPASRGDRGEPQG